MSVWIEDFDQYFLTRLSGITATGYGPVNAKYFLPEKEGFRDVDYERPAIVFHNYDLLHDTEREQSYVSNVISSTPTDVTTQQLPIPYRVYYQFSIVSDFQQHSVEMVNQFLKLFPPRGCILVPDPAGGEVGLDFFQVQFINADEQAVNEQGKSYRVFRKIYRYVVLADHDSYGEVVTKKVLTRHINPKSI